VAKASATLQGKAVQCCDYSTRVAQFQATSDFSKAEEMLEVTATISPMQPSPLLANIALFVTAAIWGSAFVAQRDAAAVIPAHAFNALRFSLGSILVLLVCLGLRRTAALKPSTFLAAAVLGTLLFLGSALQQIGMSTTTAGKAGFITGLYVVFVPVLLALVWKRHSSTRIWMAVFLALIGLGLLSLQSDWSIVEGDFYVFLCSICFALHIILTERLVVAREPLGLAALQFLVVAILSAVSSFTFEQTAIAQIERVWMNIAYAGVLSVGVAYTLQTVAQKYTNPVSAGIILSLESVAALTAGWLLLDETLSLRQALGCVLILAGCTIAQLPSRERPCLRDRA
jgi:drug/metabolite transporter (DMT)-like permease